MIMSLGGFYCHKYDSDPERDSLSCSNSQFKLWEYKEKWKHILYKCNFIGIIFSPIFLVEKDQALTH